MNQVTNSVIKVVVLAMIFSTQSFGAFAGTLSQSTTTQTSAKIEQWMKQSGFTYKKATDTVWVVKLKGKSLEDFEAFVATIEGIVIVGVVMGNKKNLKISEDLLYKILKQNHENDFVKIGFDNGNDLFVRTERKVRTMDLEELKSCLDEITAASDRLYTEIKTYLLPSQ